MKKAQNIFRKSVGERMGMPRKGWRASKSQGLVRIFTNQRIDTKDLTCFVGTRTKAWVTGIIQIYNNLNPIISNNLCLKNSGNPYVIITSATDGSQASTGVRVEHNIFSGSGATFASFFNGLVVNNIFYGTTPNGTTPFYSNTFSNNLILSAYTFPVPAIGGPANSDIGNITGIGPLFTNAPVVTSYNATYNYTLQAGSVCINAATTGENIGPSGGLYPWTGNLSLKASAIPIITLFGNSGLVPQNQPLKSNIKAKSN